MVASLFLFPCLNHKALVKPICGGVSKLIYVFVVVVLSVSGRYAPLYSHLEKEAGRAPPKVGNPGYMVHRGFQISVWLTLKPELSFGSSVTF